jgi:methionine--tRNA ligase beta chain
VLVNQWLTLSNQVIQNIYSPADVEVVASLNGVGSNNEYLCGSACTIADVLLYAAVASTAYSDAQKFPTLARWAQFVERDELIATIRVAKKERKGTPPPAAEGLSPQAPTGSVKPSAEEIERRRLEKEKAKAEKEKAAAAQGSQPAKAVSHAPAAAAVPSSAKTEAADDVDSTQLYVRVGKITTISRHPDAEKLYVEQIDLGGEVRTIVSGLVDYYAAEQLQGQLCLVVCNMKPKALKGVTSNGMVLCASGEGAFELVSPPAGTAPGTRVSFGGKLAHLPPPVPSNTVIIKLLQELQTNDSGVVCWKGAAASVPLGTVTSKVTGAVVK